MQLIVSSRYIKSGTDRTVSRRKYYTKYIATREGVEFRNKKYATDNQQKLLSELLHDFPEAKKYLEYEDYKKDRTQENASELISAIIELLQFLAKYFLFLTQNRLCYLDIQHILWNIVFLEDFFDILKDHTLFSIKILARQINRNWHHGHS